jgi:3-phosphoshikimate 1-carboxyvinyltransferase
VFFLAAAAVSGGSVEVGPLSLASRQGDRVACDVLAAAGVEIIARQDCVRASGPVRKPLVADLRDAPDLFPALAVVAACAPAGSRFDGLDNLRHKESDRLAVMVDNLGRLGVGLEVADNALTVTRPIAGTRPGQAVEVTSAADHRIAMAMAVAALAAGPLELDDGSCVHKSFPRFWEAWSEVVR